MITLHESNITSFPLDNGIGVLSDAIRAYAEEELNGMFEFYMEYDSEGAFVDELKEERIIKAKAQDKLGYQLFRIYSITKNHENDNLIVNAQHITYDLANNFVEELKANRLTKKQVMEKIGSSTVLPHTFNVTSSNTTTISSTSLYRTNPLQMIAGMEGSVLQIWGGQIERDNFNLILHDRRGHDDGVTVTYEKNITGLEATFDISGLVTRIFPYVFIEATDDEPERLITVTGKYIDSPHIDEFEVIRTEPVDYSSDDRIDTQDKTDTQIRQQLTNLAKNYFKETGNDRIKVEMEVQFAHLWETEEYKDVKVLELVGMGDTVTINHSKLKVDATAIVNYIKYDCIAQVNEEVKLGSVKARLTDSINKIDSIEKKVEQAESHANQAIVSANGKNTTFYGPDEPVEGMQKGDLWFKVIDGQYHKTYRFDGIEWQLIIDMDNVEAKAEAQQARDRADAAVNRANQATQTANTAIGQAQTSFDLAQESLTLGQGLTSRMTDAEGNLTALNQTTQSLAGQLSDVKGNITTLTATVDGLQTTVSDVQGNVSNLTQLSNTLQTRLSDAEGNINELTLTSQSMQSTISSLQDDWNNLEIGGRNLILNSSTETSNADYLFKTIRLSEDLVFGNTYVISFYGELGEDREGFRLFASNGYSPFSESWFHEVDKGVYQLVFTYTDHPSYPITNHKELRIYQPPRDGVSFSVGRKFKLEKGNKATDWTPAPEDMATQTQITQLSDVINFRVVHKGDVINQINLDTSGVLIGGDKIFLDGNVTVTGDFKLDGSAHIKDASIGTAQIAFIDAAKINSGEINTNLVNVFGGNALDYTMIQGSYLESRGRFTRSWRGVTDTHDVKIRFQNGYLRARNETKDWSLYFSDFGISTYADAEGSDDASGSLIFRDHTYSTARSVMLHSHYGVVALKSEENRVVLDAPFVEIYGTGTRVQALGVPEGYTNFYIGASGTNQGELRVTNKLFYNNGSPNYLDVRARDYNGRRFIDTGSNSYVYIGSDLGLRVTSKSTNDGTISYRDVHANQVRAMALRTNPGAPGTHLYLGVSATDGGEVRVTNLEMASGSSIGYRPIRARSFYESSSREYKTNIEAYNGSALSVINDLTVVTYNLKDDLANGIVDKKVGFISEDSPAIATRDGKAIQSYQLSAYNTKAIQELDLKFTNIEAKVNWLEIKNQYLRQKLELQDKRIKQLEGAA